MNQTAVRRARGPLQGVAPGFALLLLATAGGCGSTDTTEAQAPAHIDDARGDASVEDANPPRVDAGAAREAGDGESDATPTPRDASPEASPDEDAGDDGRTDAGPTPLDAGAGPQACGFSSCPPGAACPDLTVDRYDLMASIVISQRTFQPTDCAIAEGCITQTGTRTLLRFDTGTVNTGTADLVVGDPTMNACFTFSQCHQHYHFRGVGRYTLYESDGVTVAASGHKQGFCLEDVEPYEQVDPPPPDPATPFDCNHQGLHVGWEDVYPNDIDCQWIDVTGVPPGDYVLSVEINAGHYLPESNYDNNEARVPVTIP